MNRTITLCMLLLWSLAVSAQTEDETAIRKTLNEYMSGQRSRVRTAFHESAMMKYIDYKTGEFKDVPIAEYIGRLEETPSTKKDAPVWVREIVHLNAEGNAAQAKIKIDAGTMMIYDYMNLLKINGEWKIVSKIFTRHEKSKQ